MWWIHESGVMACIALLLTAAAPMGSARGQDVDPVEGPRKIVVGTTISSIWQGWPGLDERLAQLGALIDEMAAQAEAQYGTGLDLAVLTEYAVTAGRHGHAADVALPLEGPILDYFAAKAREHDTYIVIPMILEEDRERGLYTNAAVLVDRAGALVGIYRKVHPVAAPGQDLLEGGVTPGTEHPVFDTDFGRLGIQICFDMSFDDGWRELAAAGAEIVAWPTAAPQTLQPAHRAHEHGYYLVSSTPRNNATVFDPLGQVVAQIESDAALDAGRATLVAQVDLDYAILWWQQPLREGALFDEAFGPRAGYRYSRREDSGVFWSNDPGKPIGDMVEELGLERADETLERNRRVRERVLGDAPPMPSIRPAADVPPVTAGD
ncbi:MAG: carbon-nitrogen hydrolase family protein [Phycisphaeraceae bacterium]